MTFLSDATTRFIQQKQILSRLPGTSSTHQSQWHYSLLTAFGLHDYSLILGAG